MDQVTARHLARYLSARDQWKHAVYVAITTDHLRGQHDGPAPVWVVARWDVPLVVLDAVPVDVPAHVTAHLADGAR